MTVYNYSELGSSQVFKNVSAVLYSFLVFKSKCKIKMFSCISYGAFFCLQSNLVMLGKIDNFKQAVGYVGVNRWGAYDVTIIWSI